MPRRVSLTLKPSVQQNKCQNTRNIAGANECGGISRTEGNEELEKDNVSARLATGVDGQATHSEVSAKSQLGHVVGSVSPLSPELTDGQLSNLLHEGGCKNV
jgi:hypothetical protein